MNRFTSIDTETFKSQFINYFTELGSGNLIKDIEWDAWLFTPGMPIHTNKYVDDILNLFIQRFKAL